MTPSGVAWCELFPTERTTASLVLPFRRNVQGFILALEAAGALVSIAATRRPVQRAYLMHWAWMIAREGQDPATVPARSDVAIDWAAGGTAAAALMVARYKLQYRPSLVSRHITGQAIDMTIAWDKPIDVRGGHGELVRLEPGALTTLYALGATWGVRKLVGDPPHWSTDGH